MGVNGRRPFIELVEVTQSEIVREAASNQEDKYKGFINQVYLNELPSLLPEEYIKKEAFLTMLSEYTTGTVTVGTGTAGVQGSTTSWTSAYTNYLLKVDGYNRLYRVTYSADTFLTFQNSLSWVEASGTGKSYTLFQDRYQLPSDFSYMIMDDPEDPCVVSRYVSNAQLFLEPLNNDEFERQFNGVIGDIWAYSIKWISEIPYMFVLSAPSAGDILRYWYIPQLTTMTEYTTGTVTFTTGTAVTFSGANLGGIDTSANQYFIRNDADGTASASKWTKILSVNSAAGTLTLSSVWNYTSGSGQTYTISEISKWPARFDDAMIYKAALIADPDNAQVKKWEGLYQEAVSLDRTVDARRANIKPFKEFFGARKK
jgi:hypothetical protein